MADRATYRALLDLVGAPFVYGGRGPDSFDCFGLVRECWRLEHGVLIPDFTSPEGQGAQAAIGINQLQQWESVPCTPGSMAAFRVGRFVSHCGYMLDDSTMIHAQASSGGVTVQGLEAWRLRIAGFYRYVG